MNSNKVSIRLNRFRCWLLLVITAFAQVGHALSVSINLEGFMKRTLVALGIAVSFSVSAQTASKQNGEEVAWDSIVCRVGKCEPVKVRGYLFAKPGDKAVVIVSHGSVGVDYRAFDRVDRLREANIAALVPEHWASRGLGEILTDLKGAPAKGASELNMAFDIYTAASWLRKERGFDKVGAIGASYGGGAQITVQQKWARDLIEKVVEFNYKKPFVARPLEAQVSLYGFCGYRNKLRDKFSGAPLLHQRREGRDRTGQALRAAGTLDERARRQRQGRDAQGCLPHVRCS